MTNFLLLSHSRFGYKIYPVADDREKYSRVYSQYSSHFLTINMQSVNYRYLISICRPAHSNIVFCS
jgi:hypothetical protein